MNANRSFVNHLRRHVWFLKDCVVDGLCTFGLIADPQKLQVAEVTADFRVTSSSERWRVQNAMGERKVLESLVEVINDEDCFWDIGAAVGTYSCIAFAAGATVVSFEPHPGNRERCKENIQLNGFNPDVRDVALSDSESTLKLTADDGVGSGMHRISPDGELVINTVRGDDVNAPTPDVIKIDVEGHEQSVLRGMESHLRSIRCAFVECHPEFNVEPKEVERYLQDYGFTTWRLHTGRDDAVFVGATRNNKGK